MADSPNSYSGAPGSPNQFDPASPGYDPASPPHGSVSSNNSDAGTPSHVSAPSSPLSAHADSDDEYRADSPNIPVSPEADTSMDQPYNPVSPPHDAPSSSRSPPQVQDPDTSSPRYRENDDETSNIMAKNGSDTNGDVDDDHSEKRKSPAGSDAEDDDDENVVRKKKRIVDSDDSDEDDAGSKRNLLDSDDSDDDMDEEQRKKKLGNLMVNIFGEDVEEDAEAPHDAENGEGEQEDGDGQAGHGEEGYEDDYGEGHHRREDHDDRDNTGFEWDFDVMLREKKAERKRKRRKHGDGIDIINDDDGIIAHMVNAMKNAAKDDRHSNTERKPALKKRKMLADVKMMLLRTDTLDAMIEGGMMSAVSEWLAPLPDKSLPALEIRTELLKILQGFGRLDQGILKQSGLGRAVMLLYKHPRETKENKAIAAHIIREWSRPIFQLDTDFRSVSREERLQRDLEHMSSAKKKKLSGEAFSGEAGTSDQNATPKDEKVINRARVPRPSTRDYVVRPKSNVEGEFKGERKARAFARLDKAQREFMERTKRMKVKRAVGVSLEGRNMAI